MNIRDLWETIVLRDVLGYTVPGVVTVATLALLGTTVVCTAPNEALAEDLTRFRWPLLVMVLSLGYLVGHLQAQIVIAPLEDILPSWDLGKLASQFLDYKNSMMGAKYRSAALETLSEQKCEVFWQALGSAPTTQSWKADDPEVRAARGLWKLCDYYVLRKAPDIHATYMGRYFVLALLFSNLGVSAFVVALGVLMVVLRSRPLDFLLASVVQAGLILIYIGWARRKNCGKRKAQQALIILYILTLVGALAVGFVSVSGQIAVLEAVVVSLGLYLTHQSGFCRKEFIERTFPIFYVLTLSERESRRVAKTVASKKRTARRVERVRKIPRRPRRRD